VCIRAKLAFFWLAATTTFCEKLSESNAAALLKVWHDLIQACDTYALKSQLVEGLLKAAEAGVNKGTNGFDLLYDYIKDEKYKKYRTDFLALWNRLLDACPEKFLGDIPLATDLQKYLAGKKTLTDEQIIAEAQRCPNFFITQCRAVFQGKNTHYSNEVKEALARIVCFGEFNSGKFSDDQINALKESFFPDAEAQRLRQGLDAFLGPWHDKKTSLKEQAIVVWAFVALNTKEDNLRERITAFLKQAYARDGYNTNEPTAELVLALLALRQVKSEGDEAKKSELLKKANAYSKGMKNSLYHNDAAKKQGQLLLSAFKDRLENKAVEVQQTPAVNSIIDLAMAVLDGNISLKQTVEEGLLGHIITGTDDVTTTLTSPLDFISYLGESSRVEFVEVDSSPSQSHFKLYFVEHEVVDRLRASFNPPLKVEKSNISDSVVYMTHTQLQAIPPHESSSVTAWHYCLACAGQFHAIEDVFKTESVQETRYLIIGINKSNNKAAIELAAPWSKYKNFFLYNTPLPLADLRKLATQSPDCFYKSALTLLTNVDTPPFQENALLCAIFLHLEGETLLAGSEQKPLRDAVQSVIDRLIQTELTGTADSQTNPHIVFARMVVKLHAASKTSSDNLPESPSNLDQALGYLKKLAAARVNKNEQAEAMVRLKAFYKGLTDNETSEQNHPQPLVELALTAVRQNETYLKNPIRDIFCTLEHELDSLGLQLTELQQFFRGELIAFKDDALLDLAKKTPLYFLKATHAVLEDTPSKLSFDNQRKIKVVRDRLLATKSLEELRGLAHHFGDDFNPILLRFLDLLSRSYAVTFPLAEIEQGNKDNVAMSFAKRDATQLSDFLNIEGNPGICGRTVFIFTQKTIRAYSECVGVLYSAQQKP